ncbi:PRC-barrel domain-containing protein [Desulfosporosinus sp. PR]|uniref:PRC-barrel domain-containing protein n=1 Tax=Candidatus Desulfosporosinus nitrosoreducens TaxID=3401928 RepID=UPI0027E8C80C|nr:PRC-barrel domain-containing protein [Desulfosporosinus sp. PR]MDQ7096034.1 PRC-barrel domain-containing protein [Desulfosporosinus sp. PR]
MKPSKEIIGLRIISISDGTQIGVVKDFVLNPQGKTLDFVIVDQPTDYFGAKIIAFADILGLGEFAITIPHPGVIQDVAQNVEAQKLLNLSTRVIGTKVLTKKGQLIGEVTEILIDEETGRIAKCIFEADGAGQEIEAEQVITLGKELLIVEGSPALVREETRQPESVDSDLSQTAAFESELESEPEPDSEPEEEPVSQETEVEAGFNLFEQRQLQYFIGKGVEKDIILDNGDVLRAGEQITPGMIAFIKTRSTLMEITSHLQKN